MGECHLLLYPVWFLITLLWEIGKVSFCYNWDKEYSALMGFKCGGLCNEQDKRDLRTCMHILLLSQDDELLNWEQSLPESPSVVSFIDKASIQCTFYFSLLQFSMPHRDYAAVNIANGMNSVRNLWSFVLPDCYLLLGRVNDIWSHSSLFKLGCMLRRAPCPCLTVLSRYFCSLVQ